jgi:RHS repeat-associated protein
MNPFHPLRTLLSETRPGGITVTAGYDGHGRLISYARQGDKSLTHVYNGLDDRVATTTTPSGGAADTRRFLTAPDGRMMGEYGTSATDVRAEFIWLSPEVGVTGPFGGDDGLGGYMPIAVATTGGTVSWVHGNHMGVPIAYTNASGTAIPQPTGYSVPGFPGQSQTFADLYYNRYRDYDPTTGSYIQADPIGLAGGSNPYLYAGANPVRYMDPSGRAIPIVAVCAANPAACAAAVAGGAAAIYGVYEWITHIPGNPARKYHICLFRGYGGNRSGGGGMFGNPPMSDNDPDEDGPCEIQKESDELACNQWNISCAKHGYSKREGYALCMKSVQERYAECRSRGMNPARITTPLFLPTNRRGIPDPTRF